MLPQVQGRLELLDWLQAQLLWQCPVENAVNVSYLENLRFEGRRARATNARELLTPLLRQALAELEEYLERLFGKKQK